MKIQKKKTDIILLNQTQLNFYNPKEKLLLLEKKKQDNILKTNRVYEKCIEYQKEKENEKKIALSKKVLSKQERDDRDKRLK